MNEKTFTGFDYTTVSTTRTLEAVYSDSYPSFGWELDGRESGLAGTDGVCLKFKRERRIENKTELSKLQRQFDSGVEEIANLEKSKTMQAAAVAYIIGIVGTAFMAGSVFAVVGGMIPLCIVLAIPGFAGWVIPYLCYTGIRKKKAARVTPLIDKQYDAIYEICEQAGTLLNAK